MNYYQKNIEQLKQELESAKSDLIEVISIRLWWHETHNLFKPLKPIRVPTIGVCYGLAISYIFKYLFKQQ